MYSSDWILIPVRRPEAVCRLFCFPYAGGQAAMYFPLARALSEHIELVAVQLPGRANRMFEPPLSSVEQVVTQVMPNLLPLMDKPFALLGYSNGCLQGYEVALYLQKRGLATGELRRVIMAARSAPHLNTEREPIHLLPDAAFKRELMQLGGTPKEVLAHEELLSLMLPTLRADFAMGHSYRRELYPQVAANLTWLTGTQDVDVPISNVKARCDLFAGDNSGSHITGDHFFIHTQTVEVACIIAQALKPDSSSTVINSDIRRLAVPG